MVALGVSVSTAADIPFAWGYDDGSGAVSPDPSSLNSGRVTQCGLSRICGVCKGSLGRPIAFVGTTDEVGANAFHAPPLHAACAATLAAGVEPWQVVTTSGYELVRPDRDDPDRLKRFVPNSLL